MIRRYRLASFATEEALIRALHVLWENGVSDWDIATPMDVERLEEELHREPRSRVYSVAGAAGGLFGLFGGFLMQWYSAARDMPLDIGGRPLNSWPAFIPITFILMVLCATLSLTLTFIVRLRLPEIFHPLFATRGFDLSLGRFFLIYNEEFKKENLLNALSIEEVPWDL